MKILVVLFLTFGSQAKKLVLEGTVAAKCGRIIAGREIS